MPSDITGRPYRRLRLALKDRVAREGLTCAIPTDTCPGAFDLALVTPHPWSFVVHHPVPRSMGGDVCDPANMVQAHKLCNEKWGARVGIALAADPYSEAWPI